MNLKDLKTARWIMIVVIVLCSLLQGTLGLRSLYKDVQKEFYLGTMDDPAIYSDMVDAAEYGFLIKKVLVLNEYLASDSDLAKAIDLSYNQFKSVDTNKTDIHLSIELFMAEKRAVDDLIVIADRMNLDEKTLKSYAQYKAEYEESMIFINRNDFKETVSEYNQVLNQFPASLFKRLARIERLQEFQ